jgi:disulfide bond formation protein DsbB
VPENEPVKILGRHIDDRTPVIWAMWASAIALTVALASQYLGGLAPCKLCIWQRIPHGITIVIGLGALLWFRGPRERIVLTWLACLTFAGSLNQATTIEDLRQQLLAAPVVRCNEIPWSLIGVSIAGWNAVASIALMIFCGVGAWKQTRRRYS